MGCPAAKRCYTHTWYGTFHGTNESDNGKMNQIVGIFRSIAQSENCAVEIEQHTRKPAAGVQGDYTGHDGRGAALRAQRVLNHMSKEDGGARHTKHERTLYVRVDNGKANNSPPQQALWHRLVSVCMPNGDSVGGNGRLVLLRFRHRRRWAQRRRRRYVYASAGEVHQ